MPSNRLLKSFQGQVKPILSVNKQEAKLRVLSLYRAWYRQIPFIIYEMKLPISESQAKAKLREIFYQNRHVTDIRVIDLMVIKGQMELREVVQLWQQDCNVMNHFKVTYLPKPRDFISKFLAGKDSE